MTSGAVAIVVTLILGLSASTITPLLLAWLTNRARRRERAEDKAERETVIEAARRSTEVVQGRLNEVHTIVNSQRTEMRQYIATLTETLRAAGIGVPNDPSLDPADPSKD